MGKISFGYTVQEKNECALWCHIYHIFSLISPPEKNWKIFTSAWNCDVWPWLKISDLVQAVGIWQCGTKNCRIRVAGGAWNYTTTAAASVRWALFCVPWQCLGPIWIRIRIHVMEHANFLSDLYALSCLGKFYWLFLQLLRFGFCDFWNFYLVILYSLNLDTWIFVLSSK